MKRLNLDTHGREDYDREAQQKHNLLRALMQDRPSQSEVNALRVTRNGNIVNPRRA